MAENFIRVAALFFILGFIPFVMSIFYEGKEDKLDIIKERLWVLGLITLMIGVLLWNT